MGNQELPNVLREPSSEHLHIQPLLKHYQAMYKPIKRPQSDSCMRWFALFEEAGEAVIIV